MKKLRALDLAELEGASGGNPMWLRSTWARLRHGRQHRQMMGQIDDLAEQARAAAKAGDRTLERKLMAERRPMILQASAIARKWKMPGAD